MAGDDCLGLYHPLPVAASFALMPEPSARDGCRALAQPARYRAVGPLGLPGLASLVPLLTSCQPGGMLVPSRTALPCAMTGLVGLA